MYLQQQLVHVAGNVREGHLVDDVTTKLTHTMFAYQRPYFVESYLLFVVIRINHGAKVLLLYEK